MKRYRKNVGKTLSELSSISGLTMSQIHELEKSQGTMATLERACSALGLEWIGGLASGPTLGVRLERERLKRNMGKKEAATKAGISVAALSRAEADRAHIATVEKILLVLAPKFRARILERKQPIRVRDIRLTPPEFIAEVAAVLGGPIDLDPCGHAASFVGATTNYFEEDDGLSREWLGKTFCNPPWSEWGQWMKKGFSEWRSGGASCVIMLLPSRTGDAAFHELSAYAHVVFLKGRMLFCAEDRSPLAFCAPFPVMVVIFGGDQGVIERAASLWAGVHVPRTKFVKPERTIALGDSTAA